MSNTDQLTINYPPQPWVPAVGHLLALGFYFPVGHEDELTYEKETRTGIHHDRYCEANELERAKQCAKRAIASEGLRYAEVVRWTGTDYDLVCRLAWDGQAWTWKTYEGA